MNRLKEYALLSLTLFFILLGAAMPRLVSQIQDFQLRGFRKEMELNAVKLTLKQKNSVGPALQLISKTHTESPWTGETVLTAADARQAALDTLMTMEQYGLISERDAKRFRTADGNAEPQLLVGEDGSAALIWFCTWEEPLALYITIDDATGKAVRILTNRAETGTGLPEKLSAYPGKWFAFLRDYYGLDLATKKGAPDGSEIDLPTSFHLLLSSEDGSTQYDLNLEITNRLVFFNYLTD